jgi:hypothetical protein
MRRTFYTSTLALLIAALPVSTGAQTRRGGASNQKQTPATAQTMARQAVPLPASDAVLTVALRRLFTEAVPRVFAGQPERVAHVNADVAQFKARTGIDARDFDTLAVGARLVALPSGATKLEHLVAIARGTFRPDALVAAGRLAAGNKFSEQKYGGKSVYVFAVNDEVKLFGLLKTHVSDLAMSVLDQNTLAVGEPDAVRAAIDAQGGRGRIDQGLLNFVQNSGDLAAFAGNVPTGAFAGMDTGLPNVDRALAAIRGFYGSVGVTPAGFQMTSNLRAQTAADAKQLFDTAQALKQVAPGLISMAGERAKFAQGAINNLKLTMKGNEVQFRLELPQGDIAALLRVL